MENKEFTIQKSEISGSQNSQHIQKNFTITKKIAKHGSNSIIVIPKILQGELKPKMIVELNIKVLEEIKWNKE